MKRSTAVFCKKKDYNMITNASVNKIKYSSIKTLYSCHVSPSSMEEIKNSN